MSKEKQEMLPVIPAMATEEGAKRVLIEDAKRRQEECSKRVAEICKELRVDLLPVITFYGSEMNCNIGYRAR